MPRTLSLEASEPFPLRRVLSSLDSSLCSNTGISGKRMQDDWMTEPRKSSRLLFGINSSQRRRKKIMIEAWKKADEDYDRGLEEGRGRL